MPKKEQPLYSAAWARWKKRIADGWGPVSALIVEDTEPMEPTFKIGDTVKLDHGSVPRIGTVEEIDRTHGCTFYGVRFSTSDKRWLSEDNLQAAPAYLPAIQ
jgi:hypothetical protein